MNIKIKASGVACMVGDDYERVYGALVKAFGDGSGSLFSKRVAGHEYLQWEISGDGWRPLSDADPFMGAQVRHELGLRREAVINKFGANRKMAFSVLTVPSDEYVYYKADSNGSIDIKLTAWGYMYPERVDGGNLSGMIDPEVDKQHLIIRIENDGNGVPYKSFKLNGFNRMTDNNGELIAGDIPVGTEFNVDVDGTVSYYKVRKGEGMILFDVTQYSRIEVFVKENDLPVEGITVTVNYGSRCMTLTTNAEGKTSTDFPHDLNNGICNVKVEEITKGKILDIGDNIFEFNIVKKHSDPPQEPDKPEVQVIPDIPKNSEKTEEFEVPEISERSKTQEAVNKPEVTEEPEVPVTPEKTEEPEISVTPEKTEEPEVPKDTDHLITSDTLVVPESGGVNESGGSMLGVISLWLLIGVLVTLTYFFCGNMMLFK